jgi:hypothetical protein
LVHALVRMRPPAADGGQSSRAGDAAGSVWWVLLVGTVPPPGVSGWPRRLERSRPRVIADGPLSLNDHGAGCVPRRAIVVEATHRGGDGDAARVCW